MMKINQRVLLAQAKAKKGKKKTKSGPKRTLSSYMIWLNEGGISSDWSQAPPTPHCSACLSLELPRLLLSGRATAKEANPDAKVTEVSASRHCMLDVAFFFGFSPLSGVCGLCCVIDWQDLWSNVARDE